MSDHPDITFQDLFRFFIKNKFYLVFTTIIATILAISISLVIPPVFTATTILVPVNDSESSSGLLDQLGGVAGLAGISMPSSSNNLEVVIAEISSREFAEKFIIDFNLLGEIYPDLWDLDNSTWKQGIQVPSAYYIQKKFRESYSVVKDVKTGLVYLTVQWSNPEMTALIANGLVESYENFSRKDAIVMADRKIGYLEQEIRNTALIEVKTALFNLIERESKAKMIANTADSLKFKIIDPAYEPEIRSWPARKFITLLGAFLGLMAGIIIILVKFLFLNKD